MEAGMQQFCHGFSSFQVVFDNRFYVTRLDTAVPGFIGQNPHAGSNVALPLAVASNNLAVGGRSTLKPCQNGGRAITLTVDVLTNEYLFHNFSFLGIEFRVHHKLIFRYSGKLLV
jgi:hypothetical protein